jgi:hypothetical protein
VKRFLLPLLAVVGLLISPIAASAAQAACSHGQMSAMAGMDHARPHKTGSDPCCDKTGHKKTDGKSCAAACALACGVAAALPTTPSSVMLASVPASKVAAPAVAVQAYQPSGPEPPPKSIA